MTNVSDRELLELIAAQVGNLTTQVDSLASEMQEGFKETNDRIDAIERTVIKIENDHGEKLSALFDFQKTQEEVNGRVLSALDCIDNRIGCVETEVFKHTTQLQRIEDKLETHDAQIHVLDKTKTNIK